jgi:hypothetical protein
MTCGLLLVVGLLAPAVRAEDSAAGEGTADGKATLTQSDDPTASKPSPAPLFAPLDHWRERFQFDREYQLSDQLSLAFETRLFDLRERSLERSRKVDPGKLLLWERNTVGNTAVRLGFLGGRLRLTTRYGWSQYDRSASGVDAFASSGDLSNAWTARRDLVAEPRIGHALVQSLEASLWNSDALDVSAFGSYRRVDADFVSVERTRKGRRDAFGGPPGTKIEYGGNLRLGPARFTLARTASRKWMGEDLERLGPTHRVNRAAATLSLLGLRERTSSSLGKPVARLLPGSVWASVAEGKIDREGENVVSDATKDTNFGMSWSGTTWSMSFNYWRAVYDSRQPGAEDADWLGEGAYLGYGHYASRWDVYASAGFGRYTNEAPQSRSVDLSLDGSLTVSVRPEHLPDLATTVSYGGYQSDYLAWDAESRTRSLSLAASLDFAKLLRTRSEEDRPSIRAAYRYTAIRTQDGFSGSSGSGEHAVLLLVRLSF